MNKHARQGGGSDFKDRVEASLKESGIAYASGAAVGGLRPDFVVVGPDGSQIVIEAKAWDKQPGFRQRAGQQARLYRDVLGADEALIVVESLQRSRISEGVVTIDKLAEALALLVEPGSTADTRRPALERAEGTPTVFAAMPFRGRYDDVYFVAMAYAAESVGAVCRRVDQQAFSGDIVAKVKDMIADSAAVIVDLSESNPNVLYEAGLAHAWGKPSVHICSTPLADLPFDVRGLNTIKYEIGRAYHLREPLAEGLAAVIG